MNELRTAIMAGLLAGLAGGACAPKKGADVVATESTDASGTDASEGPACTGPPWKMWCVAPHEAQQAAERMRAKPEARGGCPATISGDIDRAGIERLYVPWVQDEMPLDEEHSTKQLEEACCYRYQDCALPGGRPLFDERGAPMLACDVLEVRRGGAALADRLARAWLSDGWAEHASIASFERAAAELERVRAPRHLIAGCRAAALDEVKHAVSCFALARRYGGLVRPRRLPSAPLRTPTLLRVAIDTFLEGCVGETLAALGARRAAAVCRDHAVTGVLETIAADEARHAALAWETVAWAVRSQPTIWPVLRRRAAATQPRHEHVDVDSDALELAAHGRLDAAAAAAVCREGWQSLILPALGEIGRCLS